MGITWDATRATFVAAVDGLSELVAQIPRTAPGAWAQPALGVRDVRDLGGNTSSWSPTQLKQAGYAPGEFTLSWPYATDQDDAVQRKVAVRRNYLLVHAFRAAGFKVTPFPTTSDQLDQVNDDPAALTNLRVAGWCYDWPSGSSWFPVLFGSPQLEASTNLMFFTEPAVERQIERISRLPIDQQPAAWGALDKTIMTRYYPAIVTGYDSVALLHGSQIGGMHVDNIYAQPTWKDIYVTR